MTDQEFSDVFDSRPEPPGLGVVCGLASGGLECLDVDLKNDPERLLFNNFRTLLRNSYPDLVDALVRERTPSGGFHIMWRVDKPLRNIKLATVAAQKEAVLETRGEGGFLVISPTTGYSLNEGSPDLTEVPTISVEDRDAIFAIAQFCDADPKAPEHVAEEASGQPGSDFNARGDALALLGEHGWTQFAKQLDGRGNVHLTRPGKDKGTSATWNEEKRVLFCFTSSAELPIGANSLFSVFAYLKAKGDFSKAAKQLRGLGFGDPEEEVEGVGDLPPLLRGSEGLPKNKKELVSNEPPTLIPNLLRVGNRCIVGAHVKGCKSILVNNLAMALAEGREWLGKELSGRKVLLIDLEVDEWELGKRLFGLADRDEQGMAKYSSDLYRLNLRKRPELLDRDRLLGLVRKYDAEVGFDVIIVDCLYQVLGGLDENSNSDMAQLSGWLTSLEERGAAVICVHHFGKGNESHAKNLWDRFRGASSLAALFDAAITLGHHEKKDHLIVEFGSRAFAADSAIVAKFDPFPKMVQAPEEDPTKYRRPGRQATGDCDVVAAIQANPEASTSELAAKFGMSQQSIRDRARKVGYKSIRSSNGRTHWGIGEGEQSLLFEGKSS